MNKPHERNDYEFMSRFGNYYSYKGKKKVTYDSCYHFKFFFFNKFWPFKIRIFTKSLQQLIAGDFYFSLIMVNKKKNQTSHVIFINLFKLNFSYLCI